MTNLGVAIDELCKKLSKDKGGFMKGAKESYAPAFILMSDGIMNMNTHMQFFKMTKSLNRQSSLQR